MAGQNLNVEQAVASAFVGGSTPYVAPTPAHALRKIARAETFDAETKALQAAGMPIGAPGIGMMPGAGVGYAPPTMPGQPGFSVDVGYNPNLQPAYSPGIPPAPPMVIYPAAPPAAPYPGIPQAPGYPPAAPPTVYPTAPPVAPYPGIPQAPGYPPANPYPAGPPMPVGYPQAPPAQPVGPPLPPGAGRNDGAMQALELELAAEKAKVSAFSKEMEEFRAVKDQLLKERRDAEINNLANLQGLDIESDMADTLKKVLPKVIGGITERYDSQITKLEAENTKYRQAVMNQFSLMTKAQEEANYNRANAEIIAAHPDFIRYRDSPEFISVLMAPSSERSPQGGYKTFGDLAKEEYSKGNGRYIAELVSYSKGRQPSIQAMAGVGSVVTASVPPQGAGYAAPGGSPSLNELAQWKAELQTGRIDLAEYRRRLRGPATA